MKTPGCRGPRLRSRKLAMVVVAVLIAAMLGGLVQWSPGVALAADTSTVRFVHTSPDTAAVDIYLDGAVVAENVAYTSYTKPTKLAAGDHELALTPTGKPIADATLTRTLAIKEGRRYIVALLGMAADLQAKLFGVNSDPLAADTARVRVIHASPDAPAVDVAIKGGAVLFADLSFAKASEYQELTAGEHELEARLAGTTTVALPIPPVTFEAGMIYDIIATGLAADNSLALITIAQKAKTGPLPPTAEEIAYLNHLVEERDFAGTMIEYYDQLMADPRPGDSQWLSALGLIFSGWVIAYWDFEAEPPERYADIQAKFVEAMQPLAEAAEQMSGVEQWLDGSADYIDMSLLDLATLAGVVETSRPVLAEANAMLDTALAEATAS